MSQPGHGNEPASAVSLTVLVKPDSTTVTASHIRQNILTTNWARLVIREHADIDNTTL